MLLLLSRFSRVRLCATPEMAAHQAPPSLGFSSQEHWSGLQLLQCMKVKSESEGAQIQVESVNVKPQIWRTHHGTKASAGFSIQGSS